MSEAQLLKCVYCCSSIKSRKEWDDSSGCPDCMCPRGKIIKGDNKLLNSFVDYRGTPGRIAIMNSSDNHE